MNHLGFRGRNQVEINGESRRTYGESNRIKFKTSMISSNLCDYSYTYIIVSEAITIDGEGLKDTLKRANERVRGVMLKNCSSFTECINHK